MKTKLPLTLMLAFLFCLTGCKSEVDKCVDALVKRDEAYAEDKSAIKEHYKTNKTYYEANHRLSCLKAQAGQ